MSFIVNYLVQRIRLDQLEELIHTGTCINIREFCWSLTLLLDPVPKIYFFVDKLFASYCVYSLGALVNDTL